MQNIIRNDFVTIPPLSLRTALSTHPRRGGHSCSGVSVRSASLKETRRNPQAFAGEEERGQSTNIDKIDPTFDARIDLAVTI